MMMLRHAKFNTIVIRMPKCGLQAEVVGCRHGSFPHLRVIHTVAELQGHVALLGSCHTHQCTGHLQHDRVRGVAAGTGVLGLKQGAVSVITAPHPQLITRLTQRRGTVVITTIKVPNGIFTKVEFVAARASLTPSLDVTDTDRGTTGMVSEVLHNK